MVIALFTVDLVVNFKSSAKFQIGECGANSLFPGIRKIESVDSFVYNYCILVDNKCSASYSMRINNFDRIMEKTKCIKERQ